MEFIHLSMGRKDYRFLILVVTCSIAGVVLGGTSSWAQSSQCLQAKNVTSECLTQNPFQKTIEGMGVGLLAGAGAAAAAAFQVKRQSE